MGFYTMTRLPPPVGIDPRRARAVLQVAIELFFHAFVLACRGGTGTETHPPPLLRSYVARARRRKDHGASWTRFLSEHWAAGLITGELLLGTMSKLGARS
jgi:hypothetical protein